METVVHIIDFLLSCKYYIPFLSRVVLSYMTHMNRNFVTCQTEYMIQRCHKMIKW